MWDLEGVCVEPGDTITDWDYAALTGAGFLVARDDASPLNFEQAALDVHMSDDARVRRGEAVTTQPVKDGHLVIQPGETLSIKTQERFYIPADVQGQVSPKALLTTLGLSFPTTHVDPGYDDHLYLPVVNAGQSPVRLPVGRAIGKVELQRLRRPVQFPWSGASGFRDFASELIEPGRPLEARRRRVEIHVSFLWIWVVLLTAYVLSEPVADLFETIDIKGGFVDNLGAPIVVIVASAALIALGPWLAQRLADLWRIVRFKRPSSQ